jgi:hypothetical protein
MFILINTEINVVNIPYYFPYLLPFSDPHFTFLFAYYSIQTMQQKCLFVTILHCNHHPSEMGNIHFLFQFTSLV